MNIFVLICHTGVLQQLLVLGGKETWEFQLGCLNLPDCKRLKTV